MDKNSTLYGKKDFVPSDPIDHLSPGTFYLTKVDKKFQRSYQQKGADGMESMLTDDSVLKQNLVDSNQVLRRLSQLESKVTGQ